jgi:hypothetical protein
VDRWAGRTDQRFTGHFEFFYAQIPCQIAGIYLFKD